MNSLRVAVGARLCQCLGESVCVTSSGVSICVATPNPEGFCCVGDGSVNSRIAREKLTEACRDDAVGREGGGCSGPQ
ncbi:hypothetical protein QL285_058808 [Trifolium repens]|nr:hypothetical protein QL285_058808 [Trifolium repens]